MRTSFFESETSGLTFKKRYQRYLLLAALMFCTLVSKNLAQEASYAGSDKHVLVDKTTQLLTAYEGNRIVMIFRVSTGARNAWTPDGDFQAGDKSLMHYSTLFHRAPHALQRASKR